MQDDNSSSKTQHIYEDFEDYEPASEKYSKPTIVGTVIRIIFYVLIVFVNCALIFRVCMANDPGDISSPTLNDAVKAAYADEGEDFHIYTQTIYDMFTKSGVFYSTGLFMIPGADEVQVTVRYNVRTMTEAFIREEFGLDDDDTITEEMRTTSKYAGISSDDVKKNDYFVYRITDEDGSFYIDPASDTKLTRFLYVYHKLTFDGIDSLDENLYLEIYPLRDGVPDYGVVFGRMKIYSVDRARDEYELSGSERARLNS